MLTLKRITCLAALAATATIALTLAGSAAALSGSPTCTKRALSAALRTSSAAVGSDPVLDPHAYACAGGWATAGAIVGARPNRVEVTVVFHAAKGRWHVVPRSGPCRRHAIPRRIYRLACETN